MSDVEETIAVPKKATEAMTKAATAFAMQSCITSSYSWNDYMSDLWAVMVANAPAAIDDEADGEAVTEALEDYRKNGGASLAEIEATPKPSPVCVEVEKLKWGGASIDHGFVVYAALEAIGVGGTYYVVGSGEAWRAEFVPVRENEPNTTWLEKDEVAAHAACDADHARRILELVNARSVESVERAYLERLIVEADRQADDPTRPGTPALSAYRWLRSLTDGEG